MFDQGMPFHVRPPLPLLKQIARGRDSDVDSRQTRNGKCFDVSSLTRVGIGPQIGKEMVVCRESRHKECQRSNIYEDIDMTYERNVASIGSKITMVEHILSPNVIIYNTRETKFCSNCWLKNQQ